MRPCSPGSTARRGPSSSGASATRTRSWSPSSSSSRRRPVGVSPPGGHSWIGSRRWRHSRQPAPADVLRQWSGLGYNRRALNLQRTATGHRRATRRPGPRRPGCPRGIAGGRTVHGASRGGHRLRAAGRAGRHERAAGPWPRRDGSRQLARPWRGDAGRASCRRWPTPWCRRRARPTGRPPLMDIGATLCRPLRPDCAACPLVGECRFAARRAETASAAERVPRARRASEPAARARTRRAAEHATPYETSNRWLRGPDHGPPERGQGGSMAGDRGAARRRMGQRPSPRRSRELRSEGLAETDGAGRWRLPAS